jgi:hypothetical protein
MMHLSGWLTPTGMWSVDPLDRVADTGLSASKPPIDVGAYAPNGVSAVLKILVSVASIPPRPPFQFFEAQRGFSGITRRTIGARNRPTIGLIWTPPVLAGVSSS